MSTLEFEAKQHRCAIVVTYNDDTAQFDVDVPQGTIDVTLRAQTIKELHSSLGAWLGLRAKRKKEARARRRRDLR